MITVREKFIAIVNNDICEESDAIVLLEGDGFNRYLHAVNLYKKGFAPKIVFSGNVVNYSYGSYPFSEILPKILNLGVPETDIIFENRSNHTQEQSQEVFELSKKNNWKRIILVASPEHQYRAYLTFLKTILENDAKLKIYNSTASNLKWFVNSNWGNPFERLTQEFERIEKYTKLGHLATYDEAITYQKWKETQNI